MNTEPPFLQSTPPATAGQSAPSSYAETDDVQFNISWLSEIYLRHWKYAIYGFAAIFAFSLVVFLKDPPVYISKASLKIEQKRTVFEYQEYTSFDLLTEEFYKTQVQLLQSRSLIANVVKDIGPNQFIKQMRPPSRMPEWFGVNQTETAPASIIPVTEQITRAIDVYSSHLDIEINRQAPQIVFVSFNAPTPDLAAAAANLHAEHYIRYSNKSNALFTDEYIDGLDKQLETLETRIQDLNDEIYQFKKESGFFQLQGISSYDPIQDIDDRLSRIRTQLSDARNELTKSTAKFESLFEPGEVGNFDAIRKEVITSAPLAQLRAKRNEIEVEWAVIQDKYFENHPEYISVKNQIDATEKAIAEEIQTQVIRSQTDYEEAIARQADLLTQEQTLIKEKYNRDAQWNKLSNLEKTREQLDKQKFSVLQDKQNALGSLDTQKELQNRTFEIVDRAEAPRRSANRNWIRILFLSLAAGLSASLTLVLLIEFQDRTLRTQQQIEHFTGINVMGSIPQFRPSDISVSEGRISESMVSPCGEAFNALRTRFLFSDQVSPAQSIVFSSATEMEGKSTVTVNLGASLALIGKRVVLIDCDLRKPALHTFFGESKSPGLAEVIEGVETIDDVLIETDIPGLFLIPAGNKSPRPAELFSMNAFDDILRQLRDKFDFIFIDSPPTLATADPIILSKKCDRTVLVIRYGKLEHADLNAALEQYTRAGASVFSFVLNSVPAQERTAYARYNYGAAAEA